MVNELGGLAANSFFSFLNKGFNVLYPMLISAYLARVLHANGVGSIAYWINIVSYFVILASLGSSAYAIKKLATYRTDHEKFCKTLFELLVILTCSSLFSSIFYYVIVCFLFDNSLELIPMLILGIILVSNIFNFDWYYEALENYRFLAIKAFFVKLTTILLVLTFVHNIDDINTYIVIYALSIAINNFINLFHARSDLCLSYNDINIKQHIRPVLFLFFSAIATEVYTLMDSTMLGMKASSEYLAYYTNAVRVVRATYGVLFSLIAVYNPRLNFLYKTSLKKYLSLFQQYYDIAIFLSLPTFVLLFFLSEDIIYVLFTKEFSECILTLKILSVLVVVFTIATVFGHVALIIYGKERIILIAAILGAISNFVMNIELIPLFQHNGAALASIISEILVTTILVYVSIKQYKISFVSRDFTTTLLSSMVLAVVCYYMSLVNIDSALKIVYTTLIGFGTYILCTIWFGGTMSIYLKNYFRNTYRRFL